MTTRWVEPAVPGPAPGVTVSGTYMSMPPTAFTRRGNPWKLTVMMWLMGMPVYCLTVLSASEGPPYHMASVSLA